MAKPTMNDLVTDLRDVFNKYIDDLEAGAILMAFGIVSGMVAKVLDDQERGESYEGLDVINSVAHQTYDAAQSTNSPTSSK